MSRSRAYITVNNPGQTQHVGCREAASRNCNRWSGRGLRVAVITEGRQSSSPADDIMEMNTSTQQAEVDTRQHVANESSDVSCRYPSSNGWCRASMELAAA